MDDQSATQASTSKSSVPPWQADQEGSEQSFGAWLKKQRQARSIKLEEVAAHTKISERFLRALEEDQPEVLPAQVFVRGFLRQYAKFVGLDADQVVSSYVGQLEEHAESDIGGMHHQDQGNWKWLTLVVAGALVLGGAGYWTYYQASQKAAVARGETASAENATSPLRDPILALPTEAADTAIPGAQNAEQVESGDVIEGALAPVRVTVDFVEDCWVESTVDGVRQISTIYAKGESLRLEANERVWLRLGNFGGSVVNINDRRYPWPNPESRSKTRELEVDADFIAAFVGANEVNIDGAASD